MPLGNCKDWCQHEARGNGLFVCWKCGHRLFINDQQPTVKTSTSDLAVYDSEVLGHDKFRYGRTARQAKEEVEVLLQKHLEQNDKLQKENEELKKDLEWAIDELDGFIANDDCPYYLENIKSIKDKWFKGDKK